VPQRIFQGDFAKLDLIQKIKAVKELLKELHFNRVNVDLVDVEYPELVFKIEANQLIERANLEGFAAFWQEYLRKYFKNEELVVQIEKNL
jgi:outer membrane protein assembly factor BamA